MALRPPLLSTCPPARLRAATGVLTDIDDTLTRHDAIEPAARCAVAIVRRVYGREIDAERGRWIWPAYLTAGERRQGFAEVVQALLDARGARA